MKKLLLAAVCAAALSCPAFAAGYVTLTGPDGTTVISPTNPLPVTGGGSSAPPATAFFGQAKIVTTGTPVPLPTIAGVNGFVVRAKGTNTGVSGVDCAGPSGVTTTSDGTGNGACEPPGSAWSFAVSQIGSVYVNGAAGDVFFVYGN